MIILTLILLAIMEVSLSFDNAVLNAGVLREMPQKWQNRFLTWGMLVAVFGMRLVFPVLIVCVASGLSIAQVTHMAIYDPIAYGTQLAQSHISISAFGSMFLLLVFLEFICDSAKEVHWLAIERKLGLLSGMEIVMAIVALVIAQTFIPEVADKMICLLSGLLGICLYTLIKGTMGALSKGGTSKRLGLMGFLYLEVLDASCSLDGVIGAFALTNNIIVIMVGLGIGALTIRSLTLKLVRGRELEEYVYLEHGAHYGIGALAIIMLVDTFHSVPEPVTGLMGLSFIGLSLLSSIRRRKNIPHAQLMQTPVITPTSEAI